MTRKTITELNTQIATDLADNTTGDISASDVRSAIQNIVDSAPNLIPFSPALVAGTEQWLDFTDEAMVTKSSNVISGITDKSIKARHLTNAGATNTRALWVAASGGTLAYASFDGGDYLGSTAPYMYRLEKCNIFIVLEVASGQDYKNIVSENSSTSGTYNPIATGSGTPNNTKMVPYISTPGGSSFGSPIAEDVVFNGTKVMLRLEEADGLMHMLTNGHYAPTGTDINSRDFQKGQWRPTHQSIGGQWTGSTVGAGCAFKIWEMIVTSNGDYTYEMEGYLAHKHGMLSTLPTNHPYKVNPPNGNSKIAPEGVVPDFSSRIIGAGMGDSITAWTVNNNSVNKQYYYSGFMPNYIGYSGGRVEYQPAKVKASAGEWLNSMRARVKADFGSETFDVLFFMGGTNNRNNGWRTNATEISRIINYICYSLQKKIVVIPIPPGNTADTENKNVRELNAWIKKQHGTRHGRCIAIDTDWMADSKGWFAENTAWDSTHPAPYGGMIWGKQGFEILEPIWGKNVMAFDTGGFDYGNILANGHMTGTTGTIGSGLYSGIAATSYTVSGSGGTGRAAYKSVDGQVLQLNTSGGGSSDEISLIQSVSQSNGWGVGDKMYGVALIKAMELCSTNISEVKVTITLSGTGIGTQVTASAGNGTASSAPGFAYMNPGEFYLITPDLEITAGSSMAIEWKFQIVGNSTSAPTSALFKVKGAGLFKRIS